MNRTLRLLFILPLFVSCVGGDNGSEATGADTSASTNVDSTSAAMTAATTSSGSTSAPPTGTDGETTMGTDGTTGSAGNPPASPTDLNAAILEGGVHVTWKDASDNEDQFVIENKAADAPDFSTVIELPFDSVTYHDINVQSGVTYVYRVKATNADGEALSNEVMIQVP